MKCIALDAMGVIFNAADDVAELLVPFIKDRNKMNTTEEIEALYIEASLGIISPDEFWNKVNLSPDVEDTYLSGHSLVPGVKEFLENARLRNIPVWCLSNDVERWSAKLRVMFGIEELLTGAVISSEARLRKPDSRIYQCFLDRSGYKPSEVLFVDDRIRNVEAAAEMGINTILFSKETSYQILTENVFASFS
jgi:putative hydrolase of the HAD superfamily